MLWLVYFGKQESGLKPQSGALTYYHTVALKETLGQLSFVYESVFFKRA